MFWQVDEVTGMMSENLQKIMERGEKMEELEDKAARLEEGSKQFQMSAAKVKKQLGKVRELKTDRAQPKTAGPKGAAK